MFKKEAKRPLFYIEKQWRKGAMEEGKQEFNREHTAIMQNENIKG